MPTRMDQRLVRPWRTLPMTCVQSSSLASMAAKGLIESSSWLAIARGDSSQPEHFLTYNESFPTTTSAQSQRCCGSPRCPGSLGTRVLWEAQYWISIQPLPLTDSLRLFSDHDCGVVFHRHNARSENVMARRFWRTFE